MTNSGSSPEPSKKGLKVTLLQGVIGAVSLAGTTAIPLVVQRCISPPAPATSPTPTQVTSPSPQVQSIFGEPSEAKAAHDDKHGNKVKGKKKGKKDD